MNIKLEILENGEIIEKSFSTIRMRGRAFMRVLEIQDVMEEADKASVFTADHYNLMCEFICEMFGSKFTLDELLDGIDLEEIYPTFRQLSEEIGNKTMKKVKNLVKK